MDCDTERDLIVRALAGDVPARNTLIQSIWPFIYKTAIKYSRRYNSPAEDLAQIGALQVIKTFHKFDPSRGVRFISYFGVAVERVIQREASLDGLIRLPSGCRKTSKRSAFAEKVIDKNIISLAKFDRDADCLVGCCETPEDIVARRQNLEKMKSAIRELPKQQMRALSLECEGRSNYEIQRIIGVTRQRVKQLCDAGKKRLSAEFV